MNPALLAAKIKDCALDYSSRIEVDRMEVMDILREREDLILDFIADLSIDLGVHRAKRNK